MRDPSIVQPQVVPSKIQPPRPRPGLIPRARLEQRLAEAVASRPLTLLCAPAGFGKTAALTRQIALLPAEVQLAWISVDEDDDLHRFLLSLFEALDPFDLPWRSEPDALISVAVDERADRRGAAAGLATALAGSETPRGLIVVDDAHRIHDAAVFEFLAYTLERLPPHWGLVIASRIEPPLPLTRLRARDQLAEFRQADLSFSQDEVGTLVAHSGDALDPKQLLARTGGWPAGLRLALSAWQRGRRTLDGAMDRDMFEFLAAEVLDEMPAELREFLLRCSILPQLSARRAAIVSGDARAGEHVAEIERRGLFVTVQDGEEPVLTLHDLVREFLEQRLTREHPELLRELLLRAAASEPDPARRMAYLLRAGAVQEAEQALEEAAQPLLAVSAAEPVLRLVEHFPPERRERSPILLMLRGEAAWERWDWRGMSDAMQRAAAGFEAAADPRRLCRAQVFAATAKVGDGLTEEAAASVEGLDLSQADVEARALGAAIRTWCAIDTGKFDLVAGRYMAVLEVLEQTEQLRPWSHCFQRTLYVWFPGMAPVITRLADGVMRRSGERATPIRAIANVYAAWLALWRGDLALAHERLNLAEGDARWIGNPVRTAMFLNTARAILHAVRGEAEPARNALEVIFRYFATSALPSGPVTQPTSMQGHYRFLAVRLAGALDDAAMLREQAALVPPPRQIKNYPMLEAPLATIPARLAALDGRHADAAGIWSRLLEQEAKLDVLGLAEEARLRHADALLQLGRRNEAAATLKPLLARVAESGSVGGVLLAGRATIARVAGTPWREELAWNELAMLRGWAQRYGGGASAPALPHAADSGPLTARELDVLARIAAGESNKLIARALELSPHTVKRHVANILEKLEISSRGEAAAWYRAQPPMARR